MQGPAYIDGAGIVTKSQEPLLVLIPALVPLMGPRPAGTSIDRIDNDGPYAPAAWSRVQPPRNNCADSADRAGGGSRYSAIWSCWHPPAAPADVIGNGPSNVMRIGTGEIRKTLGKAFGATMWVIVGTLSFLCPALSETSQEKDLNRIVSPSERHELVVCWTDAAVLYASKTCESADVIVNAAFGKCLPKENKLRDDVVARHPFMGKPLSIG